MADQVTILIPSMMRPQVGDQETVDVTGSNVSETLAALTEKYPELRQRLFSEPGKLNRFVNIFVNDEDIRFLDNLDTEVKPGDEVSIIPAIAGGGA